MKRRLYLLFFFTSFFTFSQNVKYNQFWGELRFNGTINQKWSSEFDFRSTHSSAANESNLFEYPTRRSYAGWAHYFLNSRWKLSGGLAYIDNKNSIRGNYSNAPEWRMFLQGTYYIHRVGYTLTTRMRTELRDRKNSEGDYNQSLRYRQEFKYIQPINSQRLRAGTLYGLASEEIYLASNVKEEGITFFDKNRFAIGAGYLITDDFQIEATYLNDYQPRDLRNITTNIFMIRLTYNNLAKKIIRKVKSITDHPENEDEETSATTP